MLTEAVTELVNRVPLTPEEKLRLPLRVPLLLVEKTLAWWLALTKAFRALNALDTEKVKTAMTIRGSPEMLENSVGKFLVEKTVLKARGSREKALSTDREPD